MSFIKKVQFGTLSVEKRAKKGFLTALSDCGVSSISHSSELRLIRFKMFRKSNRRYYNFVVFTFCRFRSHLSRIWCWSRTNKAGRKEITYPRKEKLLQKHGPWIVQWKKRKAYVGMFFSIFFSVVGDNGMLFICGRQGDYNDNFFMKSYLILCKISAMELAINERFNKH